MENKIDVKKIADQNDKFRKTFEGGKVLLIRKITIRMVNTTLAVLNIVDNKSSGKLICMT